MRKRPLILISNDDGVHAQGIEELAGWMRLLGDVVVVAPDSARSGVACSITSSVPVRISLLRNEVGWQVYSCSGTPVDCIKLALEKLLPHTPDLVVSGINHGDNLSVSVHYSGTVGAVYEACMKDVPAVAFSLATTLKQCDFSPYRENVMRIARYVLRNSLPKGVCLNVNFPQVDELKGLKVCRMAQGNWVQEWKAGEKENEYLLTGYFVNLEPDSDDTDCWAVEHGMAAVTPLHLDATHVHSVKVLENEI